jgi:hypothetical protein
MDHLSTETLARLVDETPDPREAEHLAGCRGCASELDALRAQTQALAALPEIRPPLGDWEVLEARLRSEGLVREAGPFARIGLAHTPPWMRVAAAAALFLGGSLVGSAVTSREAGDPRVAAGATPSQFAATGTEDVAMAAAEVRIAEENYVNALARYRQLVGQGGGEDMGDPSSRFAALEYLVAASQAALRQAPADPFLNGLLASTLAEREVTLRRISNRQENWF